MGGSPSLKRLWGGRPEAALDPEQAYRFVENSACSGGCVPPRIGVIRKIPGGEHTYSYVGAKYQFIEWTRWSRMRASGENVEGLDGYSRAPGPFSYHYPA